MISDDLVNSYHLLLCALDLVYGNAVQCSNRKELLNPGFKGKFVNQGLWDNSHFCVTFALGSFVHSTGSLALKTVSALKAPSLLFSIVLITRGQSLCNNAYGKSCCTYHEV